MQRRGQGSQGGQAGSAGPALRHPVPQHPARVDALASPPLETATLGSAGSSSKPRSQVSTGPGEYQRFSSPPVPTQPPFNPAHGGGQQPLGGAMGYGQPPVAAYGGAPAYGQPARPPPQGAPVWGQMGGQPAWASDPTAQIGMQFGKSAVAAGSEYVERNFSRFVPVAHLQHSFNVSNIYVLNKLRLVLFPWRHRPWSRLIKRSESSGQAEGYKPPREDINSPDLYIPTMALVTYILLAGIVAGLQSRFHPSLLGAAASKSLGIVFIEFLVIKLGCYLLNIGGEGTVTDLLAYSGYKFVGIITCLVAALLQLRGWAYALVFTYVFCANALFLLRSLRYVVLPDPALSAAYGSAATANPPSHAQKRTRTWFLFSIAASQLVSMFFLSRGA